MSWKPCGHLVGIIHPNEIWRGGQMEDGSWWAIVSLPWSNHTQVLTDAPSEVYMLRWVVETLVKLCEACRWKPKPSFDMEAIDGTAT